MSLLPEKKKVLCGLKYLIDRLDLILLNPFDTLFQKQAPQLCFLVVFINSHAVEELPVRLVSFALRHQAVQLVDQLGLHLRGTSVLKHFQYENQERAKTSTEMSGKIILETS